MRGILIGIFAMVPFGFFVYWCARSYYGSFNYKPITKPWPGVITEASFECLEHECAPWRIRDGETEQDANDRCEKLGMKKLDPADYGMQPDQEDKTVWL